MSEVKSSSMLVATNGYLEKLNNFAKKTEMEFTDYQKSCVVNAMREIYPMVESSIYTLEQFAVNNIVKVLEQTAFLGLNSSAVPRECYFIIRKNWDKKKNCALAPTLEFGIEGAGNDVVLNEFGRDVKEIKSYIVYKDDEFTEGFMNGWDMVLPTYRRKFKTNIPEKVVYLIKKDNGEIDVQYADTEDVKKSLLANARQNGAEESLLREINKESLYAILDNKKWLDYVIEKKYGNNSYKTPLFSPAYTSVISQGNMIERKLRNHATRKYPKNFDNKAISELYEETFEDIKEVERVTKSPEEMVENADKEFDKGTSSEPVIIKEDERPQLVVVKEEEPKQEPKPLVADDDGVIIEEKPQEKEEPQQEKANDDEPNWDE